MRAKLNYTNRILIPKKFINISILEDIEKKPFRALLDFSEFELPEDARVIIEAYVRRMQSQRYDYGRVSNIRPPKSTELGLLGESKSLKFRVLVVNEFSKILASSEAIRLKKKVTKTTLLPVELAPLKELLWNLQLDGDEPLLQLNERINEIKNIAAFDPRFIHCVYPAVVRELFMYLAVVDPIDFGSPDIEWHVNWLTFGERIYTNAPNLRFSDDKEEILEWIDGVVSAFSETREKDWKLSNLKDWRL